MKNYFLIIIFILFLSPLAFSSSNYIDNFYFCDQQGYCDFFLNDNQITLENDKFYGKINLDIYHKDNLVEDYKNINLPFKFMLSDGYYDIIIYDSHNSSDYSLLIGEIDKVNYVPLFFKLDLNEELDTSLDEVEANKEITVSSQVNDYEKNSFSPITIFLKKYWYVFLIFFILFSLLFLFKNKIKPYNRRLKRKHDFKQYSIFLILFFLIIFSSFILSKNFKDGTSLDLEVDYLDLKASFPYPETVNLNYTPSLKSNYVYVPLISSTLDVVIKEHGFYNVDVVPVYFLVDLESNIFLDFKQRHFSEDGFALDDFSKKIGSVLDHYYLNNEINKDYLIERSQDRLYNLYDKEVIDYLISNQILIPKPFLLKISGENKFYDKDYFYEGTLNSVLSIKPTFFNSFKDIDVSENYIEDGLIIYKPTNDNYVSSTRIAQEKGWDLLGLDYNSSKQKLYEFNNYFKNKDNLFLSKLNLNEGMFNLTFVDENFVDLENILIDGNSFFEIEDKIYYVNSKGVSSGYLYFKFNHILKNENLKKGSFEDKIYIDDFLSVDYKDTSYPTYSLTVSKSDNSLIVSINNNLYSKDLIKVAPNYYYLEDVFKPILVYVDAVSDDDFNYNVYPLSKNHSFNFKLIENEFISIKEYDFFKGILKFTSNIDYSNESYVLYFYEKQIDFDSFFIDFTNENFKTQFVFNKEIEPKEHVFLNEKVSLNFGYPYYLIGSDESKARFKEYILSKNNERYFSNFNKKINKDYENVYLPEDIVDLNFLQDVILIELIFYDNQNEIVYLKINNNILSYDFNNNLLSNLNKNLKESINISNFSGVEPYLSYYKYVPNILNFKGSVYLDDFILDGIPLDNYNLKVNSFNLSEKSIPDNFTDISFKEYLKNYYYKLNYVEDFSVPFHFFISDMVKFNSNTLEFNNDDLNCNFNLDNKDDLTFNLNFENSDENLTISINYFDFGGSKNNTFSAFDQLFFYRIRFSGEVFSVFISSINNFDYLEGSYYNYASSSSSKDYNLEHIYILNPANNFYETKTISINNIDYVSGIDNFNYPLYSYDCNLNSYSFNDEGIFLSEENNLNLSYNNDFVFSNFDYFDSVIENKIGFDFFIKMYDVTIIDFLDYHGGFSNNFLSDDLYLLNLSDFYNEDITFDFNYSKNLMNNLNYLESDFKTTFTYYNYLVQDHINTSPRKYSYGMIIGDKFEIPQFFDFSQDTFYTSQNYQPVLDHCYFNKCSWNELFYSNKKYVTNVGRLPFNNDSDIYKYYDNLEVSYSSEKEDVHSIFYITDNTFLGDRGLILFENKLGDLSIFKIFPELITSFEDLKKDLENFNFLYPQNKKVSLILDPSDLEFSNLFENSSKIEINTHGADRFLKIRDGLFSGLNLTKNYLKERPGIIAVACNTGFYLSQSLMSVGAKYYFGFLFPVYGNVYNSSVYFRNVSIGKQSSDFIAYFNSLSSNNSSIFSIFESNLDLNEYLAANYSFVLFGDPSIRSNNYNPRNTDVPYFLILDDYLLIENPIEKITPLMGYMDLDTLDNMSSDYDFELDFYISNKPKYLHFNKIDRDNFLELINSNVDSNKLDFYIESVPEVNAHINGDHFNFNNIWRVFKISFIDDYESVFLTYNFQLNVAYDSKDFYYFDNYDFPSFNSYSYLNNDGVYNFNLYKENYSFLENKESFLDKLNKDPDSFKLYVYVEDRLVLKKDLIIEKTSKGVFLYFYFDYHDFVKMARNGFLEKNYRYVISKE